MYDLGSIGDFSVADAVRDCVMQLANRDAEIILKCEHAGYKLSLDGQIVLPGFERIMLKSRLAPFGVEIIK